MYSHEFESSGFAFVIGKYTCSISSLAMGVIVNNDFAYKKEICPQRRIL